jgi:hypothetical protein
MSRAWLVALFLGVIAGVITPGSVVAQTLEPDLTLPGAEVRLGWGGGFVSGAWSELTLTATGGDAYTATLETSDGTIRTGLKPIRARLEVAAGSGVRSETLLVPLFVKRPVKLTLQSALGTKSVKLEPFAQTPDGNLLASSPAAYLGGVRVSGDLEPSAALTALAGGASVTANLERLPSGALGLGDLQRETTGEARPTSSVTVGNLIAALAPDANPPERQSLALALWSVAAFIGVLGLYSARRLDARFSIAGAGLALVFGAVGFAALQTEAPFAERNQRVLIGAGGWGLSLTVWSRFNAQGGAQTLAVSAQTLEPMERRYTKEATLLEVKPWSRFSYWNAPKAARVPLRVTKQWIENSASTRVENVFVVGHGLLEPISAVRRELGVATNVFAPQQYDDFARLLPEGSAIGTLEDTIVIALPEQP